MPFSDSRLRSAQHGGFTLLEVLVAMAIVAIGLAGVLTTINGMLTNTWYLRDKTLANWVAQNHIAELRLQPVWPDIGRSTDDVQMGGLPWRISTEVLETPVESLRRLYVSVAYRETPDEPLVTLAAFVGETAPARQAPGWRAGAAAGQPGPGNPGGNEDGNDGQPGEGEN